MAFTQSLSSRPLQWPSRFNSNSTKLPLTTFPKFAFKTHKITFPATLCFTAPKPSVPPSTEQDILEAVAESDGSNSTPAVRTYENDLAQLTLVGAADFQQSLTAAAADGGEAADEHISAGMDAMVIQTVFPGSYDNHSTISTRLFLPAMKVKEKARRLKSSLKEDIIPGISSNNILAMTFKQVILQQLWKFELLLFQPGTKRDIHDLKNPREVPAFFALSSSDEQVISMIAEVICLSALETSENPSQRSSNWFHKPKEIISKDSSVILYNILEHEILANAKNLLQSFNSEKTKFNPEKIKKNSLYTKPMYSKLEKIGGPEFIIWLNEHIPLFRLHINGDKFKDVKFEGWKDLGGNKWESLLTHTQMVNLANIFDMYYEDVFTLPRKKLSCGITKSPKLLLHKSDTSLLKKMSIFITSGIFLVTICVMGQIYLPKLSIGKKFNHEKRTFQSSNISFVPEQSVDSNELKAHCISIIQRIKDSFNWSEKIIKDDDSCAWIGEKNAQDIASFQVVLSGDGKVVGFQPTNRVAVNQWANNPLARELYNGKILTPGIIEPGLKINRPSKVVLLELLMSVNPESHFALVRPLHVLGDSKN